MILDPTTTIGKMRLRIGDYSDFPLMPDEVYTATLADTDNNVTKATVLVAQYILAALTGQTHQKLAQIEVYGSEWFSNYLIMLKETILNPNVMEFYPMPYTPAIKDDFGNTVEMPLIQFQKDWNNSYVNGTETQQTRLTASTPYGAYF